MIPSAEPKSQSLSNPLERARVRGSYLSQREGKKKLGGVGWEVGGDAHSRALRNILLSYGSRDCATISPNSHKKAWPAMVPSLHLYNA